MRILTPLIFTLITIGLFVVSIVPMVDNVSAEKDIEKNSNIGENTATSDYQKTALNNVTHGIQEAVDRLAFLTKS